MPRQPKTITVYKCTKENGTDFRTGTVNYAKALKEGKAVKPAFVEPAIPGVVCGQGLHVSPTALLTCHFASPNRANWRWFEGTIFRKDIVAKDSQKYRVRAFTPTRELKLDDVFGEGAMDRVERLKTDLQAWKKLRFRPTAPRAAKVVPLITSFRNALSSTKAGCRIPTRVRICRQVSDIQYKYSRFLADAYEEIIGDGKDTARFLCSAIRHGQSNIFDSMRIIINDLGARLPFGFPFFHRDDLSIRNIFYCYAFFNLIGRPGPNPWAPLVELYKLGCKPFVSENEIAVYCPPKGKKRARVVSLAKEDLR